jgi:hypothetical protein
VTHKIIIAPIGSIGRRGQLYRACTSDGAVLVEASRNPEFDACRALLARGITGRMETWRVGCPYPCMHLDIACGAKLTVLENATCSPRLVNWSPLTEEAISWRSGSTRSAPDERPATTLPEIETPPVARTATALAAAALRQGFSP